MQQTLQCPKCRSEMHTHERNGVHIEQCTNCRGIFLDFGELEALTQAQTRWLQEQQQAPPQFQQQPPAAAPAPAPPHPGWAAPPHPHPHYGHGYHGHYKKRGFMSMLFSS